MSCTTVLVGKKASAGGSTMIARNDDAGGVGHFTPKRLAVLKPEEIPEVYTSVLSHVKVPLDRTQAVRCTVSPNALPGKGIWAACGINAHNVAMTATETITSNPRVLGADPLVEFEPAENGCPERAGGIGEEDIVSLVLPFIRSAREGVKRLGALLERYGTYEMNGIAFSDTDEVWWLETIGGHHWIARRLPDDCCAVIANQFSLDAFDVDDALGAGKDHLCSWDLREFVSQNHLNPSADGAFIARDIFGSHDDSDHVYNTPRVWYGERCFNPHDREWEACGPDENPCSDSLPWCMVPEKKLTVEDVKYVLSSHYQGTPYDCYASDTAAPKKGIYRYIGINRTDLLSVMQLRPDVPEDFRAVQWEAFGSNVFNVLVPVYANVDEIPAYLSCTEKEVSTDSFYWTSRLIAALADASYARSIFHIERYQLRVQAKSRALIREYDARMQAEKDAEKRAALREEANQALADMAREKSADTLSLVLIEQSDNMKNTFSRADA